MSALIAKYQIFIYIDVFSVSIVLSEWVTKILVIIELQVAEKSIVYFFCSIHFIFLQLYDGRSGKCCVSRLVIFNMFAIIYLATYYFRF